jgi:DNA-binding beta-propeller fold protein YncE
MKTNTLLLLAVILCCFLSPASAQEPGSLTPAQTILLPKVVGGFNHMSVDAEHQRLFAAAPTNKTLEIIDLKSGKPWRSLEGEKPAAARYSPEFNQLYVPRGQSLYIYDGKTFDLIKSINLESNLDELQYDARAKQLYVGCMTVEKTGIAVIAIPEGKLLGKIPLPAKPQGIAVEQKGKRIFANMPSLKQIAVIDREKRTLLAAWPLEDVQGNTPIALDEAHHRLFVGVRQPAELIVFDTTTGRPVAKVAMNSDTDDLFYDATHKRIYVSCGEGFIDVIEQQDGNHYQLLGRISTIAGARTSTFSDPLNSFYLGVPRRGDDPAEILVFKVGK